MRLVTLLSSSLSLSAVSASTCYWPNGDAAADTWLQCPGSKHCCAEGEACLSNGLCVAGKYMTVYRGACTDKSWPISECPRVCYEEVTGGWANLYPCPSNDNEVFTCGTSGWASHVCEQQLGNYTWVGSNVTAAQLGITTSSTASSSATISASSSGTSSGSSSGSTETTTRPQTVTSSCTASVVGKDATMKTGLGVGLGLGVPLLLAAAGMLWFYVHTRRQIQYMQRRLNEQGAVHLAPRGQHRLPLQELDTGKQIWPEIQSTHRSEVS